MGSRTPDLYNAIVALYQLSYGPILKPETGNQKPESSDKLSPVNCFRLLVSAFCYSSPIFSAARNALCGIVTLPISRMRFLPFFCLSSSLRLRETSPP